MSIKTRRERWEERDARERKEKARKREASEEITRERGRDQVEIRQLLVVSPSSGAVRWICVFYDPPLLYLQLSKKRF